MDIYESEAGERMMKVSAEMKDGKTMEAEEDFMVMEKRMDKEEIIAKFQDQFDAFGKLPKSHAGKLIELADRIDDIPDMREYTELLCLK